MLDEKLIGFNGGDMVINEFTKNSDSKFGPKAVTHLYNQTLDDLISINEEIYGRKAPIKGFFDKINFNLKGLFVDKVGLKDKLYSDLKSLDYCLSDVNQMISLTKNSYSQLVNIIDNNYDELLEISKLIPVLETDSKTIKIELDKMYSERNSEKITDEEAIELGKHIFVAENSYRHKMNELKQANTNLELLSNHLKRNKAYSSTLVDLVGFFENSYITGKAIVSQVNSQLLTLDTGTKLAVRISDIDKITTNVMKLANDADLVWNRAYNVLINKNDDVVSKKYSDDSTNSMKSTSDNYIKNIERDVYQNKMDTKKMFRTI